MRIIAGVRSSITGERYRRASSPSPAATTRRRCITGASKPEQIADNCKASGVELSAAQYARIDEIIWPAVYSHPAH